MMKVKTVLTDIIAKHCGQKAAKLAQDMERNKWMTAEDALEY